jgi:hypothetical protein
VSKGDARRRGRSGVMTNSDDGDQLFEALLEVIGEREG